MSSALLLTKKASNTFILRTFKFGCVSKVGAAAGEEKEILLFQNKVCKETCCPFVYSNSPSGLACLGSNDCPGAPKVGALLGEAAAAAAEEEGEA